MSNIFGGVSFDSTPLNCKSVEPMARVYRSFSPQVLAYKAYGQAILGLSLHHAVFEDKFIDAPINHPEGSLSLIGEGLIHNRYELGKTLKLSSAETRLWSDSHWMLAAYAHWGDACINHLTGEYCFAVYNTHESTLTLVRHPTGQGHTLFYWFDHQQLYFSTQIQALLAIPTIPRVINEQKLADFLILNHTDHATTHFENVYRLPPGNVLRANRHGITPDYPRKIWHFNGSRRLKYCRDEDYVEAFDEIFDRAVQDQMRSVKPLGAMMSGGIDSSAVAVRAAKRLPPNQKLRTYTAVPQPNIRLPLRRGWYNDETPFVKAIAALNPNIDPRFVWSPGFTPDTGLEEHFKIHGQPFRSASNRVWMEGILSQARHDGIAVLLTGQMGNMTLSWNGLAALPEWFLRGKLLAVLRGINALSRSGTQSPISLFKFTARSAIAESFAGWLIDKRDLSYSEWEKKSNFNIMNPDFARKHSVLERAAEVGFDPLFTHTGDGRAFRLTHLFDGIDFAGDVVSNWHSAYGVELRDPTADIRLIEYCLSIPQEQYLLNKSSRSLSRRAFASELPDSVLSNKMHGEQDPGWFERIKNQQANYRSEVKNMHKNKLIREAIDLKKLAHLIEHWPNSETANNTEILYSHRFQLIRGLHLARYLQWVDSLEE